MSAKAILSASVSAPPVYVEDVFSTFLYTGTGAAQTITNGIDLAGKGGMVWIKGRSGATNHALFDTTRGAGNILASNTTAAQLTSAAWPNTLTSFAGNGFALGNDVYSYGTNISAATYCSWTFREAAKFFDVVTYTGTGANRTIAHNLGSVPGSIIVKRTDTTADWAVYHRSLANTQYLVLNSTAAAATGATWWNSTTPTSSVFSVGTDASVNASGGTYVAYLFAHDAGGFGTAGTDNVVSCGTYTNNSSQAVEVNLGWEPQWILIKNATGAGDWIVADTMRGIAVTQSDTGGGTGPSLSANSANAEDATGAAVKPTPTGFKVQYNVSASQNSAATTGTVTYIYIAIRRGPMRTPTTGTSVFGLSARTGTGANATVTGGQTDDAILVKNRGRVQASLFSSRLTGTGYLSTSSTAAEVAAGTITLQANPWDVMDGVKIGTTAYITNASADTFINYLFRRAPGFFDVVCYTGTGVARTVSHNLGVAPELMIVKLRNDVLGWQVYSNGISNTEYLVLNTTAAKATGTTRWNSTTPTAPSFSLGNASEVNANNFRYVAYLFATVAGVSKVGSYTGTGTTNQINCGFTAGARFVLIKRTDTTGDWYFWDTARGIVAGNDPYLLLNTTAAEVTNTDYVDTYSAGFEISSTGPAAINANGGTFIFLAIA